MIGIPMNVRIQNPAYRPAFFFFKAEIYIKTAIFSMVRKVFAENPWLPHFKLEG